MKNTWSDGVMEYWKKETEEKLVFWISITPVLQYSNTPVTIRGKVFV
ncbi:MAG: hypothetical protein JRF18_00420 [Deltaproteobacteria bacterium]|nr:hypothetical protein [Deltaproteobacteria bacterium]